ncbi:hypothetical protein [Streptomyces sp. HUAS ZL42]|uniref:hypothetical protein n=1 Tax=Streptomyces sp. HUAS ZL42 TaxID=3231715 RepID=UPI00345E19C3
MAGAFRIAEGFVEVTADETSFNRSMARLQSRRFAVKVDLQLDDRAALAQLTRFARDRTVRITADADTRAAADDLALLTRARTARITADADTRTAATRIDALTRDRRLNVRVDLDQSALSRLSSIGGGGAGGVGILSASVARLVALAVGALPTVASLAQSIAAMGPAAAVAAPAVLSLATAFAAVKVGTSGIGDAFKAAFAPAVTSGAAAESATRRVENAQRSLERAQRSLKSTTLDVADANRRAAQQTAQAERDLADAQRAARQAQRDLTAARKEAKEELEDLNARLADAQLDQRQKVLDLQDAEQELAAVKVRGGKAGQEAFDKAQLQYDRAVQALEEQQTETARLQQQAADANKAGVEGSKTVTDAKQKIADANQAVTDKTRALKDAQIEQARTAEQGLQRIRDAQDAVADAARSLTDAQTSGAAATNKLADAMARLAPNAREFVGAVLAQAGAWRALKLDVQNTLFKGLGQTFTTMSSAILPSLRAGLTGTASVLNLMAKNAAGTVTELGKTGMLKQMFDGLNEGLKPLAKIPGQFIKGLTQVSVAASPAFKRINTAAGGFADRISKQLDQAFKSGHLEKVIDQALDIAKQFGRLVGDIFGTLGNIMKAAGAAGGDALGGLGAVFKELRRITAMPEVQQALTSIFKAVNAIAKLVAGTLGAAIQAALPLLETLAPFVQQIAERFGPVAADLLQTLGKALMPVVQGLMPIVVDIADALVGVVKGITPLLKPLGDLIGAILKALGPIFKVAADNLTLMVGALGSALAPIVAALVPAVQMFGRLFAQIAPLFSQMYQAILPLLPPLTQLALSLINLGVQVLTPLMPLIVRLAQLMTSVFARAVSDMVPVLTTVIGWLTTFTDTLTDSVNWVVEKFQWMYDKVVGHSIIPDLVNAIIGWFTQLWTRTREIFNTIRTWVVDQWNKLWKAASDRWNSFWSGLRTSLSNAKTSIVNWVSGLRTSFSNAWSGMWNSARDRLTGTLTTLRGKIGEFKTWMLNAVKSLRDGSGNLWAGIQSRFSGPVKWVISNVYNNGLRKMWNTIAGKISSKIVLPAIALGFSEGGVVPGKRSNKDTVPAMLAPGERILSNAQVDRLGGHRAIDAMLGKDRPTHTGGNPTSQQERRRHQPVQGFADGGIVGTVTSAIGGAVSSAASWAKDLVVGGLKAAAMKALSALVRPLIDRIPGGGVGSLLKGMANKAVDGMLGWFTNEDKKAVGGPAVQKALAWAKTQNGKPYQWAGNGNPSWDCSGFLSAIESVIRGERPHRRWATGAFPPGTSGWVRNLNSPFMIGITNAGVGHTAGTIGGVNVESRGGDGVIVGKRARGYSDSLFTSRWGFAPAAKFDSGGLLAKGATMVVNDTQKPERILTPQQNALFEQLVRQGGNGASVTVNMTVHSTTVPSPAEARRFANDMARYTAEALRNYDRGRA